MNGPHLRLLNRWNGFYSLNRHASFPSLVITRGLRRKIARHNVRQSPLNVLYNNLEQSDMVFYFVENISQHSDIFF